MSLVSYDVTEDSEPDSAESDGEVLNEAALMSDTSSMNTACTDKVNEMAEQIVPNNCDSKESKAAVSRQLCEICRENMSKYRCPRCSIQTCCLQCVKLHKQKSGCSGSRDRTAFIAVDSFTELDLLSDYRFLEDVERQVSVTSKDPQMRRIRRNNPHYPSLLVKEARRRRIDLRMPPYQTSEHVHNESYFHKKLKQIEWHVRWRFPSVNGNCISSKVMEDCTLREAITVLLASCHATSSEPPVVKLLADVLSENDETLTRVKLFLKTHPSRTNKSRYQELNVTSTLRDSLSGYVIAEQPTIYVSTDLPTAN